ncbi:MAG: tyrosine--tRNA ligase [Actinobacteria bacterium]|nr:tyrosine--tRNA ligase [Actinomycetota bacterium]
MNAFDLLRERGFVHSVSDADGLRAALGAPVTFYCGFDPSAPSLTAGHLLPLMMAAHLQRAGHRPVLVAGGGTGLIGDPTGKHETRKLLDESEVAGNVRAIAGQLARFVELDDGAIDNAVWLRELRYLDFLRDIGRHFSVNEMLAAETYRARLDAGQPLNFVELNYRLLQAYDFLHLFRTKGCRLQIGGSDQWGNILAGVDLIRRVEGAPAFGLVAPLLTTSSGEKMGKTAAGALWLDPARTAPFAFYQYWINIEDAKVEQALGLLTFLPMERVRALGGLRGPAAREAKAILASELAAIVHGAEAAQAAREAARALFAGAAAPDETPIRRLPTFGEYPTGVETASRDGGVPTSSLALAELRPSIPVTELFVRTGLASSRGAARRLILQGGAYVNEVRVTDVESTVSRTEVPTHGLLLRAGKKRYHRIVVVLDG